MLRKARFRYIKRGAQGHTLLGWEWRSRGLRLTPRLLSRDVTLTWKLTQDRFQELNTYD